ncbi:MAG: hypothetical protein JO362_22565 [Streptomycetaceae bacterium]|nr:hypothetical protein [Streptomycetaceae bacterium]
MHIKNRIRRRYLAGAAIVLATVSYSTSSFATTVATQASKAGYTVISTPVTQAIPAQHTDVETASPVARAHDQRFVTLATVTDAAAPVATSHQSTTCSADRANNAWLEYRFEACANTTSQLRVVNARTRQQIGGMTYTIHADLQTRTGSKQWSYQLSFTRNSVWGEAENAEIVGSGKASGGSIEGNIPAQPLGASGKAQASFTVNSAVAAGQILSGGATATWTFEVPSGESSTQGSLTTPTVRCDNALKGYPTSYGCVLPAARIGIAHSLSGPYAQVARHIQDAQKSGLPGVWGSGSYLTRLTSDALIGRNRNAACPSRLLRPAGDSCDEYPFASTYQGAFLSGGKFSRRMLSDPQNTGAGRALNSVYALNRVLDKDPFQVEITA